MLQRQDIRPGPSSQTTFNWPPSLVTEERLIGIISASNAVIVQTLPKEEMTWDKAMEEILRDNAKAWQRLADY